LQFELLNVLEGEEAPDGSLESEVEEALQEPLVELIDESLEEPSPQQSESKPKFYVRFFFNFKLEITSYIGKNACSHHAQMGLIFLSIF
jgi:hypothetical protein